MWCSKTQLLAFCALAFFWSCHLFGSELLLVCWSCCSQTQERALFEGSIGGEEISYLRNCIWINLNSLYLFWLPLATNWLHHVTLNSLDVLHRFTTCPVIGLRSAQVISWHIRTTTVGIAAGFCLWFRNDFAPCNVGPTPRAPDVLGAWRPWLPNLGRCDHGFMSPRFYLHIRLRQRMIDPSPNVQSRLLLTAHTRVDIYIYMETELSLVATSFHDFRKF